MTDPTKIVISADDRGVNEVFARVTTSAERLRATYAKLAGFLTAGIGIGAFTSLVKEAIDAQARMKDLAQEAGTTAAAISRFEAPARAAGLGLDSIAGAMFKMSKSAIDAKDPMSNAAQALRAIGISATELKGLRPDEMFERVARALANYGDGLEKNAIMQELFGKSGREMNRVVAEIAERGQLAATVTNEEAEAADRLGDQMVELQMQSEAAWRTLAADLVPTLNEMLKAFIAGKKEAGLYAAAIGAMREAFVGLLGDPIQNRIGDINKEIAKLQGMVKEGPGLLERLLGTDMEPKIRERIKGLQKELAGLVAFGQTGGAKPQEAPKPPPQFDPEAIRKALAEKKRLEDLDAKGWVAYVEEMTRQYEDELREMAKITADFYKEKDRLQKLDDAGWVKKIDNDIEEYESALKDFASKFPSNIERVQATMTDLWGEAARRGSDFFNDLVFSGQKAFDVLKRHLKSFLADLLSIFTQRWILSIGASMMGVAGAPLASAAGQIGANSLGGSLLGFGASAAGGSGFFSGASGALFGTPIAAEGGAAVAGSGLFGSGGLGAGFAMGPVGWAALAVLAIAAVATAFRDKGENWKAQFGFGSNARAYRTEGVFGPEGFDHIAGDDALNSQIQKFMASTGTIDKIIAATLTSAQIATITANLAGAYPTRNDGQPSEFAFGKDDQTAAQQLTLEYLQKKYGTIFDEIDTKFAAFIRGYTGKSEDLVKEIAAFAGILKGLADIGLKGLDITALRGMQMDGEEIADTFKRIGDGWSYFIEHFTSDAEKLDLIQEMVGGTFAALGLAVPDSKEAFAALVRGLDLSTEAGQKMFQTLLAIAPAFDAVAQAAKANLDAFDQIMSAFRPGYADALGASSLSGFLDQFRASNTWAQSNSNEQLIAALKTITREDFANYDEASQKLILAILRLVTATDSNTTVTAAVSGANIYGLSDEAVRYSNAQNQLRTWVDSAFLNQRTTILSPQQRLAEARRAYEAQLALAQGGNANAAAGLGNYAQTYLDIARQLFQGSGAFNDIFRTVMSHTGGVAGISQADINSRLAQVLPTSSTLATSGDMQGIRDGILELITMIGGGVSVDDPRAQDISREIVSEIQVNGRRGVLS